jgi:hypothetical protein
LLLAPIGWSVTYFMVVRRRKGLLFFCGAKFLIGPSVDFGMSAFRSHWGKADFTPVPSCRRVYEDAL